MRGGEWVGGRTNQETYITPSDTAITLTKTHTLQPLSHFDMHTYTRTHTQILHRLTHFWKHTYTKITFSKYTSSYISKLSTLYVYPQDVGRGAFL